MSTKIIKDDEKIDNDEIVNVTKTTFYAGPHHYLYLDQGNKIQARYIWLGSNAVDMRTKTKTVDLKKLGVKQITCPSQLPIWNYDGSSTGQAVGDDSEVLLKPVKIVRDPFRLGKNIIVLCDTYEPEKKLKDGKIQPERPTKTNKRASAMKIFTNPKVKNEIPWYGIEQEYTLFTGDGKRPIGFPENGYPEPQGPYYCSVGAGKNFCRQVADAHYKACLYTGIEISGTNAEVCPGQWEFQIGPCEGIDSGDSLLIARFLLEKVCEEFNVQVKFEPKPIKGDWNGTGCHTNYSTLSMRNKGGYKVIVDAIKKLKERHLEHMKVYGDDNESRLTGLHETHDYKTFDYGVADRGASIRIPRDTEKNDCGYFEDRRPASNMDPYSVTSIIAETTLLYQPKAKDEKK